MRLWDSYKKGIRTNLGKRNYDEWCLDLFTTNPKGFRRVEGSGSRVRMIKEFRKMFYVNKFKKVPAGVIESDLETKRNFLRGVIEGDGTWYTKNRGTITIKGKAGLSGLLKLMIDLNWECRFYREKRCKDVYTVSFNNSTEKLDESRNTCDDFSYSIMGRISNPDWGALPFGVLWTEVPGGAHAVNCFIDNNRDVWVLEPQTDSLFSLPGNWNPYLVMM
jgi:hypothetical protein